MGDKFEYRYVAPTEEERKEIESIRSDYSAKETGDALRRLRALDKAVKTPPLIIALIAGCVGILVFGFGMTCSIEWGNYAVGIPLGLLGMALMIAAYPIHQVILKRRKRKYGEEILALSDELLKNNS